MPRLEFAVVQCTGEDPDYPSDSLNNVGPHSKGWQTPRFCEYPQELVLEFLAGDVQIQQLQLLSHQSKITQQIEIFMGTGDELSMAQFQRLGHLSMDDNQRSGHRAQELKSVFVDSTGRWLKLKFHKCYINKYNLYNQIGIVAINALGEERTGGGSTGGGAGDRTEDAFGQTSIGKSVAQMSEKLNDLAFDMAFDRATADKIRAINAAKSECVAREDFQAAKALKNVENQMKAIGVQLAKMENQKQTAVDREDYDAARTLRDEIRRLRDGVDARLASIPAYQLFIGAENEQQEEKLDFSEEQELGGGETGQLVGDQEGADAFM